MNVNACLAAMLLCVALALSSCTRSDAWRKDLEARAYSTCAQEETCFIEDHESYELGFLEFTEHGNLFYRQARNQIVEKIEGYSKDKGVLVVVFAHGWMHNASFDDENVESFRQALKKVSSVKEIRRDRKVVGIYLGWRGAVFGNDFLNEWLTFWDRKSVSQEIGDGGVSDVLLRLDQVNRTNKKNTLLIAGHSFGAGVVLSSVNEILLQRMIDMKYRIKRSEIDNFSDLGIGDGVVLFNPAIEANQIEQSFDIGMELAKMVDEGKTTLRNKIITVITSEQDYATKLLFPAGQYLDNIFINHEQIEIGHENKKIYESYLDVITAGHYKPFHTGNLIDKSILDEKEKQIFFNALNRHADSSNGRNEEETNILMVGRASPQLGEVLGTVEMPLAMVVVPHGEVLGTGERIKGWTYVSCCESPESCIITNRENDFFQRKNNNGTLCKSNSFPLSFVYASGTFIEDHNDVFANEVIAYLAAGTSGSTFMKNPEAVSEKCLDDSGKKFRFGNCFDFYLHEITHANL